MTWNELKAHIEVMDEEQSNSDVVIELLPMEVFLEVDDINFSVGDDVLKGNHPFLEIQEVYNI